MGSGLLLGCWWFWVVAIVLLGYSFEGSRWFPSNHWGSWVVARELLGIC